MRKAQADSSFGAASGYLILSGLSVMMFTLALQDPMFLVFGIPLVLIFVLGASVDSGNVDEDLEAVGWSSKNMSTAIPLGIGFGLIGIFIGSIITRFTPDNAASIVPDFSSAGVLATASVVPPILSNSINILSQWAVVAPSEESLARALAPYAGRAIFKNWFIGFLFGAFFWIFLHVPTFILNNTNRSMYLVLLLIATITAILFLLTKTLISSIIAHSVFNTGVIIMSQGLNQMAFYVVFGILAVLAFAWFSGSKHERGAT